MNRKALSVLCVCALMLAITLPSQAATGYQGYAVYRDGVGTLGGIQWIDEWHAGLIMTPTVTGDDEASEIAHVENQTVDASEITNWYDFMNDGNGFVKEQQGCYRPMANMTSTEREFVMTIARAVANVDVEYILYAQINYDYEYNPQQKIKVIPSDIISMRCDGFVEYVYEYNDFRIYGDDDCWNISEWDEATNDEHSWGSITPKTQAEDYMRFVADINVD